MNRYVSNGNVPDFKKAIASAMDAVKKATSEDVLRCLSKKSHDSNDLAVLLSAPASEVLEDMATLAKALTQRHFGRTISLYVPLYLSDYCSGGCVYCGFAAERKIPRRKMEYEEVEVELNSIMKMGFDEILLLTGERTPQADFDYLKRCVELAASRFHQVTVEAFPMAQEEYAQLVHAGCTGLTIYQETYDPVVYQQVHRWGPKKNYEFRLDTPARALSAGMRTVGLGVLLGLADPVADAVALFEHLGYLRRKFWRAGFSISFPRIRPQTGGFIPDRPVDERFLAQLIYAFRICLPDVPLNLSTRESARFRDGVAGVGINKMSIASKTTVGGYCESLEHEDDHGQFQVSDGRGIKAFFKVLNEKGLEPVFKNWESIYR